MLNPTQSQAGRCRPGLVLILAVILGLAGCQSAEEAPTGEIVFSAKPTLHFGVFPFLEDRLLEEALTPLMKKLGMSLRRPVKIRVVSDYAELEDLIARKAIDIGWFTPRSGGASQTVRVTAVCRPLPESGSSYVGAIICRRDSGMRTLADLKDRVFVYVDRHSNSGFLYPNRIFQDHGIDPAQFFREIRFAGTHDRALAEVVSGEADGAAVSDFLLRGPDGAFSPDLPVTVLATTTPILPDPIVVRSDLPPDLQEAIRSVFLALPPEKAENSPILQGLRAKLRIRGFTRIDP